jgi:hypothetical protein
MATTTTGPRGNVVEALPIGATLEVLRRHGALRPAGAGGSADAGGSSRSP